MSSPPERRRRAARAAELAAMFVAGPVAYTLLAPGQGWLFPALWAWALVCILLLLRDRGFARGQLWNVRGLRREARPMLLRFAVLGGLIFASVALLAPERLFSLPRERPGLWLTIMLGYPLASVYPQEVVFRAFFFRRYAVLFGDRAAMLVASAVAFALVHIIFENAIAISMTLIGGLLFSITYARSRSVLAASVEHALYGCLIFTVGIGSFFYTGATGRNAPARGETGPPGTVTTQPPAPFVEPLADRDAGTPRPRSAARDQTHSPG